MSPDTNGDVDGGGEGPEVEAGPEPRTLRPEEWVRTPRFVGGVALVVLGVLVAGLGTLGSAGAPWDLTGTQVLLIGVVAVALGVLVALSGYRLTARQRQYLDQAARERAEIRDYLALLADVAVDEPESSWEIRSRLERAERNLERAKEAVYRRDYANFLAQYYEASRQEILLYGLLDSRAEGWTLGLDLGAGANEGSASSRLRNLSRRIRSYAEESLPKHRRALVESYIGESDERPPSPLDLYYAVRVLHEWNVSRYERATQIRRFLRGGILVLTVVIVMLAVVLSVGFDDGGFLSMANATSGDASVGTGSVLLDDAFLGLVLFTGALGAVFSMVFRSFGEFYSLTTDPSIPQPVFMLEALLARTLIGSVSALFLFLVARTEFAGVVFAEGLLENPLALLVVAFVGGFSEQLVDEAVERVVDDVSTPPEEHDDRTGPAGGGDDGTGDDRSDAGTGGSGRAPAERTDETVDTGVDGPAGRAGGDTAEGGDGDRTVDSAGEDAEDAESVGGDEGTGDAGGANVDEDTGDAEDVGGDEDAGSGGRSPDAS